MRDISSPLDGIASPFGPQRTKTLAQLLFAANEPGFTFEPWDITTLYQDRAGTTPVTAAGQSVGYRRDKSGRGNHQVAVSDAKRGVYGWMPKTGRRNLLTYTEQFDNAAWTVRQATISANAVSAPDGTLTADTFVENAATATHDFYYSVGNALSAGTHTAFVYVKSRGRNFVRFQADAAGLTGGATFNLSDGTSSAVTAGYTASAVLGVSGFWKLTLTKTFSASTVYFSIVSSDGASTSIAGLNAAAFDVWGAQLEVGSTATAYQRVVSQYDITEAGVPTCYYVQADGVDDAYVTPTITPNTDKVQVFAGVRNQNTSTGVLLENALTSVNATSGSLAIYTRASVNGDYAFAANLGASYGYRQTGAIGIFSTSSVISSAYDGAVSGVANAIKPRVNGAVVSLTDFTTTAIGSFVANPFYIYSRAGTSLPFNGLDFGHAVRFGPNLDAATIARVEALIARNTPGVTL